MARQHSQSQFRPASEVNKPAAWMLVAISVAVWLLAARLFVWLMGWTRPPAFWVKEPLFWWMGFVIAAVIAVLLATRERKR